jgi:alginate O-acetyltransferase complex protein AlgI
MEFNSPAYLFLFLPLAMLVYHLAGKRARIVVGILASLIFYAWGNLRYLPLILGITVLIYLLAWGLDRFRSGSFSNLLLVAGLASTLGPLVWYKLSAGDYPLGFSFLAFQAIAYLLEVRLGRVPCERNFLNFCFFLLLFPKIPVGPIARYSQLRESILDLQVDALQVAAGLRRFIRGLAKKVLIADILARVVVPIFNLSSPAIPPWMAWLVLVTYAFQLYFDFSGYTDMAIGAGQMMGLRFMENFNLPYLSSSIGEFWRRWHISLSTWFRDFVFFPLERRRLKWLGQPINILVVFLLTGLWHGLTLNFAVWGLLHGAALVFEGTSLGRRFRGSWKPFQHLYALGIILLGWVFFRSPTPVFALEFLGRLLGDTRGLAALPFQSTRPLPFIEPTFIMALAAALIFSLPVGAWLEKVRPALLEHRPVFQLPLRLAGDGFLLALLLVTIMAMTSSGFMPALYGRF